MPKCLDECYISEYPDGPSIGKSPYQRLMFACGNCTTIPLYLLLT